VAEGSRGMRGKRNYDKVAPSITNPHFLVIHDAQYDQPKNKSKSVLA
jgi:hypothetical protein